MRNVLRTLTAAVALVLLLQAGAVQAANLNDVLGAWEIESIGDDGTSYQSTLKLMNKGDKLAGKLVTQFGDVPLTSASYDNGVLKFAIKYVSNDGTEVPIQFSGKPQGGKIKGGGTASDAFPFTFTGTRTEAPPSGTFADVLGTWTFKSQNPQTGGENTSTIIISQEGAALSAKAITEQGPFNPDSVTYANNELTLKFSRDFNGQTITIISKGKPVGDTMQGETSFSAAGQSGSIPFTGKRISKPAVAPSSSALGAWKLNIAAPNGQSFEPTIELTNEGGKFDVIYNSGQFGVFPTIDPKLDGDKLSFKVQNDFNGVTLKSHYKGVITGSKINGKVAFDYQGNQGELTFEGTKQ